MSYYTDVVATGLEDYYTGRGESPGLWVGNGALAAGLSGEVSAEQLARLFEMRHPDTGVLLGAEYVVGGDRDKVTGWDLTFSAPKSASVLWAVGGADIGQQVRDAHQAAVQAGLNYLEEHAAFSRQGKAGIRQVDTDGLVAAAFVHRSSRSGDPQLHTHVLVSGRVRCDDGVWRALDSKGLHPQLKPAGMIYQAALRAELRDRLGVAWGVVSKDGQAEIDGVPAGLRKHWSKRRREVEHLGRERVAAREAKLGRSLTPEERRREFEKATTVTRGAKTLGTASDEGLHDQWAQEAEAVGFDPVSWIPDTVNRERVVEHDAVSDNTVAVAAAIAELETSTSTWTRAALVKQLARRVPETIPGADQARAWVEDAADVALGADGVVKLAAPEPSPPASLLRRDGRSVYEPHNAAKYTTEATLEVEQHILDTVHNGRDARRAIATSAAVGAAIEAFGLGGDQAAAVRRLTLDGEAVAFVIGPAGTGKSRAMGAAAAAWNDSGINVRGLAVSAAAAGVLQAESGIASDTIAKFLHEHNRPGGPGDVWRLTKGEVLVVDEASMVSSRDLGRLIAVSEKADAKVVLVGDHAQLDAVEAGGLFRLLAADSNASELTTVRRFRHEWEADASLQLRARKPTVIATYDRHGRILGGDRVAMTDEAFDRWQHARSAGESVIVCARDHDTVDAIARRARAARVQAGEVEPGGILVAGEQTVGVGDEIVTLRNNRTLLTSRRGWVRNGDRWTVTASHADGSLTIEDATGRGRVTLPADYTAEHVALAYAVTIHKAQGVTVDRSILVADAGISAEALYVGMTRGRNDNTALVITDQLDVDDHQRGKPAEPGVLLALALLRPTGERSATDELRHALERSESLAVLKPRLANLDNWIKEHTPLDRSIDLARARRDLGDVEQNARPGRLTRSGRQDRRYVDRLAARLAELETHEQGREAWPAEHADTFAYRQQLADAVTQRALELGRAAAVEQPDHLTAILGPYPAQHPARDHWTTYASRVEAYREEFDIDPAQLRNAPTDSIQRRQWSQAIDTPRRLEAALRRAVREPRGRAIEAEREARIERGIDRDYGPEL